MLSSTDRESRAYLSQSSFPIRGTGEFCWRKPKQPLTLADVTLDHIVARAHGGEAVPLNLQVLCESCNQKKKDLAVMTMEIALDFPLRPAPSDGYEGLIW